MNFFARARDNFIEREREGEREKERERERERERGIDRRLIDYR